MPFGLKMPKNHLKYVKLTLFIIESRKKRKMAGGYGPGLNFYAKLALFYSLLLQVVLCAQMRGRLKLHVQVPLCWDPERVLYDLYYSRFILRMMFFF